MPEPLPPSSDPSQLRRPRIGLPFALLFGLTIAAQLVSLALGRINTELSFASMILPSVLALSVITLPTIWIGLKVGPKVGLGAPRLNALLTGEPGSLKRLAEAVILAAVLGGALAGLLLVVRQVSMPYLPPEIPAYGHRGVIGGLAVSFGAAVAEEVWFRLGLVTFLVWGITRLRNKTTPSAAIVWTVIVVCAVVFGAAHLPQLIAYGAGSSFAIGGTVLGNTAVGILYGWCYWKRGLLAAMAAHFSVDFVLHVLPAFWM
ncbi:MAG: CPBP family intramembrane metalloprotease [Opitutaceae bacterium]|nr:CPBP family intramembrane metalloprotease [Cephaloticoccus sp.]MCP5529975.1 CPBP family intramembrane metalloprotease [Opitutaceae bacterium]